MINCDAIIALYSNYHIDAYEVVIQSTFYMRFCNGVDENFRHHFVIIKITIGLKTLQRHHKKIYKLTKWCWNGVETSPAPRGGISGPCPPKSLLVLLKREVCPQARVVPRKKVTGPVSLECISGPVHPQKYCLCPQKRE